MYRIYISHHFRVWRNTSHYSLLHGIISLALAAAAMAGRPPALRLFPFPAPHLFPSSAHVWNQLLPLFPQGAATPYAAGAANPRAGLDPAACDAPPPVEGPRAAARDPGADPRPGTGRRADPAALPSPPSPLLAGARPPPPLLWVVWAPVLLDLCWPSRWPLLSLPLRGSRQPLLWEHRARWLQPRACFLSAQVPPPLPTSCLHEPLLCRRRQLLSPRRRRIGCPARPRRLCPRPRPRPPPPLFWPDWPSTAPLRVLPPHTP